MPTAASAISIVYQTDKDNKIYALDLSNWGLGGPTSPVIDSVTRKSDNVDVTSIVIPSGSPSVNGTTITLPLLGSLVLKEQYLVRVTFTDTGSTWEANFLVDCRTD